MGLSGVTSFDNWGGGGGSKYYNIRVQGPDLQKQLISKEISA